MALFHSQPRRHMIKILFWPNIWMIVSLQGYCLTVQLVEKLSSEQLLSVLKEKQFLHSHHTQEQSKSTCEQQRVISNNVAV